MKKKHIANLIMALLMVLIAGVALFTLGHFLGWYDTPSVDTALMRSPRGLVTLERDGASFYVQADTPLRAGDRIVCNAGATVELTLGDHYIVLGQNAQATVTQPATAGFSLALEKGEAFVHAGPAITLSFQEQVVTFEDSVATVSVRSGASSVSVYYGSAADAQAGQIREWIGQETSVRNCPISSLNDFAINQIRRANQGLTLCFTDSQLAQLEADRLAQMQAPATTIPQETQPPETTASVETTTPDQTPESKPRPTDPVATEPKATDPDETTPPPATEPKPTAPPETTPPTTQPDTALTCTITIRCDTILDNWDDLDPAKAPYVPESGCILAPVTVTFTEGETVFHVLQRVCETYGIQLEYSWTPMYDSYYIEGINHLYEFDCGFESGWMYKVNGWFPNYGCSAYTLTGGETIVWCYTCKGLGADVGSVWMG